ncbi:MULTISPECIES: flagellin [unclassified Clostridium]|uniref:flagellin N-terminal helical domain-containing protein n=1 Tax=unclassified Clostridium TaxID=2614128 RepID=UPI0032172244
MIINHNMNAMNAHRMMSGNTATAGKAMEKLSSGLRINRAGDDAAGLAISEKMRGQIRGLDQASRNGQDAISMIQTGEGALNETHSILQRMRELAVQSATDTNTSDDRAKIQAETDQLAKEITRISNTTEFNTQNLMAGGLSSKFQIGANANQDVSFSINAMDAYSLGVAGDAKSANTFVTGDAKIDGVQNAGRGLDTGDYTITTSITASSAGTVSEDVKTDAANTTTLVVTNDDKFTGDVDANYTVQVSKVSTDADAKATEIKYSKDGGSSWKTVALSAGVADIDGMTFTLGTAGAPAGSSDFTVGDQYSFKATAAKGTLQLSTGGTNIGGPVSIKYSDTKVQLGSIEDGKTIDANITFKNVVDAKTSTFKIGEVKSEAAATTNGNVTKEAVAAVGIDVSSQKKASEAITKINSAITKVSEERSKMGAYQNRLEHTIANLGTSSENLQSAESRIRDVDMAKEMMNFSKNNILSQAAQAMLAQANQQPQGVLQLLR